MIDAATAGGHGTAASKSFRKTSRGEVLMNHRALRFIPLMLLWLLVESVPGGADDWPQWRGPLRDGVWREDGVMERFPPEGPPVRWRTPTGAGFSGPAVAGGQVFLMDRAVDESASADVKTEWNYRDKTKGQERVLCLDEAPGTWCTPSVRMKPLRPARHADRLWRSGLCARRDGRSRLPRLRHGRCGLAEELRPRLPR
jgi:hypothetical protein